MCYVFAHYRFISLLTLNSSYAINVNECKKCVKYVKDFNISN